MRHIDLPDMEFRRHPRYVFSGVLHLVGNQGLRMNATDLSLSGVRFKSPRSMGVGLVIEMVFLNYNVTARGTVRNEIEHEGKAWDVGVEFDTPQPDLLKLAVSASGTNS